MLAKRPCTTERPHRNLPRIRGRLEKKEQKGSKKEGERVEIIPMDKRKSSLPRPSELLCLGKCWSFLKWGNFEVKAKIVSVLFVCRSKIVFRE
jgi:hypothetical protein